MENNIKHTIIQVKHVVHQIVTEQRIPHLGERASLDALLTQLGDQAESLENRIAALEGKSPTGCKIIQVDKSQYPAHLREAEWRCFTINRWANMMRGLFDEPIWLVGGALQDANANPRDWDVRVTLSDEDFSLRYGGGKIPEHIVKQWTLEGDTGQWTKLRWRWSEDCARYSKQGRQHTHLNIDFQVYPASHVERWFNDKPRLCIDTRADTPEETLE